MYPGKVPGGVGINFPLLGKRVGGLSIQNTYSRKLELARSIGVVKYGLNM